MNIVKRLALVVCLFANAAFAAFDPVHQDIDIFMVNPAISSVRPNVLIVLDNTANWNQAFSDEKSALVSLVNGLTDQFNVGLGMYVETGSGNDNVDGAYVRFGVRQMKNTDAIPSSSGTSAAPNNRYALSKLVSLLDKLNDKGNNNTISLAMSEVYAYFAGTTSWSSFGKLKTDYTGNTANNPLAASIGNNAFLSVPTSTTLFNSPVVDGCQNNFVIYVGNGKFQENSDALSKSLSRLTALEGKTPETLSISPSGQQGNWADEWAYYLVKNGFNKSINGVTKTVRVHTYTLAIDPTSKQWDADSLALMQSMALNGGGKYYTATSGDGGASIVDALNRIFTEIQAVNSVFASTTLPVSVNVRGTNLNQVYVGMFRPDANKAPRWYGNLKLYKIGLDSLGNLYLSDANGDRAEDPSTGFIGTTNLSFWTHSSSFWGGGWRTPEENGPGGDSDSPDGNLVEKGAVAQRLREAFSTSQDARNLYTCTSGCTPCTVSGSGSTKTCAGGSTLSATPFSTTNTSITPASLNLGTKSVSLLTAKRTVAVTAVTDRRPVQLNNLQGGTPTAITSLNNGAVTHNVSNISTAVTMPITALSALVTVNVGISSYSTSTGSTKVTTVTTSAVHNLTAGTSITISGAGNQLNGTFTVASVPTTTTFTINANSAGSGSSGTVTFQKVSTTAKATVASHGLVNGQTVIISGASPSVFNGTFGITYVDANTFTYTISSAQGAATSLGVATKYTTTATVTTTTAHNFSVGNNVTISGASPSGYNNSFQILSVPTSNTFTITTAALPDNTASSVTATVGGSSNATAVINPSLPIGYGVGTQVTIAGADSCYNGTFSISSVTANSFSYPLGRTCTQNTATSGMTSTAGATYGQTVTATLTNHGYAVNDLITIDDGSVVIHNGNFQVTGVSGDTFTFTNSNLNATTGPPPGTGYTVRYQNNPLAYVTAPGHGFSDQALVTIAGTTTASDTTASANNAYNGQFTIKYTGSDTFTYPLSTDKGLQTATSGMTASVNTTTATATVVNHNFSTGSSVDISGASPSVFNGSFVITSTGANTFTYTLPSAQADANGAIVAAAGSGSSGERSLLINWVRGQDNAVDENQNGSTTDCRASVHGDVLHSRPAVINYNRYGGDNDVYVFYGSNDGIFHAVKGGVVNDANDPVTLLPGQEAWGFVPTEGFGNLARLRNDSPVIGNNFKKPYFMDGPIGVYTVDANADGKESATTAGDKVYLYVGARRGGRYLYSLDVTDPLTPAYRWKIDNTSAGFGELGYTWSQPTVVTGISGYTNPVLIFGGGYDPNVEDVENCTISSVTAASYDASTQHYTPGSVVYNNGAISFNTTGTGCTTSGGSSTSVARSMGRAIYVVDAITGEKIWSASYQGSGADLEVPGMDYAMASDVTVVKNLSGGAVNRAYIGDTGGNLWRFDFGSSNKANWSVTKIASISDMSTTAGRRKFLAPPDVVGSVGYDQLLIGTGDREHPFDNTVVNRFYLFKDHGSDSGPGTGTTYYLADTNADGVGDTPASVVRVAASDGTGNPVITHSNTVDGQLYDDTANCVQVDCSNTSTSAEAVKMTAADGWFVTLATGEKVIGNTLALNGVVFFNTNQPSQTEDGSCVGNLGIARQYAISLSSGGAADGNSRYEVHPGGGFLPSPVHVVVQVKDSAGNTVTKEAVISGTSVSTPTQGAIGTRTRRFWYKEID